MDFTCIFFGVVFIMTGILFAFGKCHIYLSAWKHMPQQEKENIRIGPLCRNIGGIIALSGIIFLSKGLFPAFENRCFVAAMILWLILAGFDVWYINKSNRYCGK